MFKELVSKYGEKVEENKAYSDTVSAKAHKYIAEAEALEKQAAAKRRKAEKLEADLRKMPVVNWKDEVVVPLAAELAKRLSKKQMVLGPCGIGAKVRICLVDNPDILLTQQDCLEIVIVPDFENGRMVFNYETGETDDRYERGTIGYMNGLNNITARLPDSIEEIAGLLRHYPRFLS